MCGCTEVEVLWGRSWPGASTARRPRPGPVGLPVVDGNLPGQQLLAEMVAHSRQRRSA
jgi:hypothetical protein